MNGEQRNTFLESLLAEVSEQRAIEQSEKQLREQSEKQLNKKDKTKRKGHSK